jgi:Protein of unknown function (DUF3570)
VKKRYVIIGLLASSLVASGQRKDSTYRKKDLSQTAVQVLMSYYTQDNDHSAVTGGIGTEDLQVFASQFAVDHQFDSVHSFHLDTGLDVITSASTDNIDFVRSSASRTDGRTHFGVGYGHYFKKSRVQTSIRNSFSIESDYTSVGASINVSRMNREQSRQFSVAFDAFFDDLRWGRLDKDEEGLSLVYPSELRDTTWFTNYRRNSYNIEFGFFQVINRRLTLGLYPGVAYQSGLLSTPFHRVYFSNDDLRVERIPGTRLKIPLGVQLNAFIGDRWILRNYYRYYWDDFGIVSHTLNVESAIRLTPLFSITGIIRLYTQTGSDFFRPFDGHDPDAKFYTSDYDLSDFYSLKPGLALRYSPYPRSSITSLKAVELRYSFYNRSDGLKAHALTLFVDLAVDQQYARKRNR